jgi:hypothetical protein
MLNLRSFVRNWGPIAVIGLIYTAVIIFSGIFLVPPNVTEFQRANTPDRNQEQRLTGCDPKNLRALPNNDESQKRRYECAKADYAEKDVDANAVLNARSADAAEQTVLVSRYQAWTFFWQALGTVGAFFAAAIAAIYAKKAADNTKRSADIAHKEYLSAHRPRLRLRRVSDLYMAPASTASVRLDFANVGESEARIIEYGVDLFFRAKGDRGAFSAEPKPFVMAVPPGKQATLRINGGRPLSQADVDAINSGVADLCLLCIANYLDEVEIPVQRSTSVFRLYVPSRRRFVRVEENDEYAEWDYED